MNKQFYHSTTYRFRRFAGKAWSAFLSLHKEVSIGTVRAYVTDKEMLKAGKAVALALMLAAAPGMMADDGPDESDDDGLQLSLQEVQVVAEKAEVHSSSYRLITRISAEEIAQLPVHTLQEVIGYLPGVDVRKRGNAGAQADVSMRGGTFDQVLILLNGVNMTDAQTGHYSMNLPLDLSLIERIEVLQGTASDMFGLNAFAGAINIVTKGEAQESGAEIRFTTGMNELVNPAVSVHRQGKEAVVNASVEYLHADGMCAPGATEKEQTALRNSDVRWLNAFVEVNTRVGVRVQAGGQYKDAGAGLFYGSSLDQFDATRTCFASADYTYRNGPWSLEAQGSYRANYDRYEWHRGQRLYGNFHFTQIGSAALKAHFASKVGRTTLGVELRNENIHSTNLGDTLHPDGQVPNVEGFDLKDLDLLHLRMGQNRLNLSYFAHQSFFWRNLSASLGVNGNWNSRFGSNVTGGANLGYAFADTYLRDGKVYVNVNRSLRLPTFTDLYYKAGQQRGDKHLKPEEAWVLGVGAQYAQRFPEVDGRCRLDLTADAYYRWGRNMIDWIYDESDELYHARNWQAVDAAGGELTARFAWNKWLRAVSLSYAYTWMSVDLSSTVSNYLDYLTHKAVLGVEHAIWTQGEWVLGANWHLSFRDREGQYLTADGVRENYKPLLLLDGEVYWQHPRVRVSLEATNMTNRHYYDYGGILQQGAFAAMTVRCFL